MGVLSEAFFPVSLLHKGSQLVLNGQQCQRNLAGVMAMSYQLSLHRLPPFLQAMNAVAGLWSTCMCISTHVCTHVYGDTRWVLCAVFVHTVCRVWQATSSTPLPPPMPLWVGSSSVRRSRCWQVGLANISRVR